MLGRYVRDLNVINLETAVHKMTGLSARQFKLADRGEIKVGAFADITLFDPDTVLDAATFEQPIATARGIRCVIVNGAVSYRDGNAGPGRAGRFLDSNAG